jgi:hypothetical protein
MRPIITIKRPELTTEERARRMAEIRQAATRLVLETEKAKTKIHRRKTP